MVGLLTFTVIVLLILYVRERYEKVALFDQLSDIQTLLEQSQATFHSMRKEIASLIAERDKYRHEVDTFVKRVHGV